MQFLCTVLVGLMIWINASAVSAADANSAETLEARRQKIKKYSEAQRKELIRKYDAYRQLTDAERDQLRSLHKSIESDKGLQDVMQQYCDWLIDLDVTQREQLRDAKTAEQKRNLVVKFKQEQQQHKEELWRDQRPPGAGRGPIPPLSGEGLQSVMAEWESTLIKSGAITPEQQAKLENLQGTQRYKQLMLVIAESRHPKGGPVRPFEIPETVINAIATAVNNPEIPKKLRQMERATDKPQDPHRFIAGVLLFSTMNEARREFRGRDADALKEAIFNSIPPDQQLRYTREPPLRQELMLMHSYREEVMQAFTEACDLPKWPMGGRGGPGRAGPFGGPGDRSRGGPPGQFRPQRRPDDRPGALPPDGRRPPRENDSGPNEP